MMKSSTKLTLIGMPGVGKSTLGRQAAKALGYTFVDSDDAMEAVLGMTIQAYILQEGEAAFLAFESQFHLDFDFPERCILSTGGSIVHSESAMTRLKDLSTIVYLQDTASRIKSRISNAQTRGIVWMGQDFDGLYALRTPLYEAYQDKTFRLSGFPKSKKIMQAFVSLVQP